MDSSVIMWVDVIANIILLAAVVYNLRSLGDRVNALEQRRETSFQEAVNIVETEKIEPVVIAEEAVVSPEPDVEQPISTRGVSPEIVAVITGALAVLLDDQDMERHVISSIQSA